eukprot:TRINITY_DN105576_c0_g1_i1.p1 TRINITY_DN105576_c0_g1~~TRINITY_DN105576_c0_g1_i1.p1  ORF type:complete len:755 (-),score=123.04 TRINITY_DN105576_c0_g1_i1:64-2301(-)
MAYAPREYAGDIATRMAQLEQRLVQSEAAASRASQLEERLVSAEATIAKLSQENRSLAQFSKDDDDSDDSSIADDDKMKQLSGIQANGDEVRGGIVTRGDCFQLEQSVWDASIFVGLECLDKGDSIIMVILFVLNLFSQIFFITLVSKRMVDDSMSSDKLMDLIRFRSSLAHQVQYADPVSGRSLARQVCDLDDKMVLASSQYSIIDNLNGYLDIGQCLCLLATGCWISTMLRELWACVGFAIAIHTKPTDDSTYLGEATRGDDERQENKTIKIRRLSKRRKQVLMFVALLRGVLAIALLIVGVRFLAVTLSLSDLVLNTVALEFVSLLDELIMSAFAPRRARNLIAELDHLDIPYRGGSIPLNNQIRQLITYEHLKSVLKLSSLAVGLLLAQLLLIHPLHAKVDMAYKILCSGNLDFVYVLNPATGIVEATPSFESKMPFTEQEKTVLSLARPDLHMVKGWDLSEEQLTEFNALKDTFVMREKFGGGASQAIIQKLKAVSAGGHEKAAKFLPCQDGAYSADVVESRLKALTGLSVSHCSAPGVQELCHLRNYSQLRSLCPVVCGCIDAFEPAAALFATEQSGCPAICMATSSARIESNFQWPCSDWTPQQFTTKTFTRNYVRGLFQVLLMTAELSAAAVQQYRTVMATWLMPHLPNKTIYDLSESLSNTTLQKDLMSGKWDIGPGVPHPRHLQGCAFWTSWEVQMLLGVDVCSPGGLHSLRMVCPTSCKCWSGQADCPISCARR